MPEPDYSSKVAAAVLGAAIGDAMGHPTEFLSSQEIVSKYGPAGVTGFELWWEKDGAMFAPYTDDTQMAEIVLRSLLRGRDLGFVLDSVMEDMAAGFVEWRTNPQGGHRAPGNACLAGSARLAAGVHWSLAGGETAGGCGSVMRAYPFGLIFANDLARAEQWAVAHSALTHRDPIAFAACAAMAIGTALCMTGAPVSEVVEAMSEAADRYSGETAAMIREAVADANSGVGPQFVLSRLEGWAAHEAIAAAAYVLTRHPEDPRAAILEGANTPGDSDSIATLAGALVGSRVGLERLPGEWVSRVERANDLLVLANEASVFMQ